ncbi:MAG TPA: Pr6Pr family membrane protein [Solirubrobacteraceae bacterium]|nr:Pr6Pr family membrane protein [Solirubrobacteraceae bacterium]
MQGRWDRVWFAATAGLAFAGVLISVLVAGASRAAHLVDYFPGSTARALNTFAYFTIQSNLLVGASTLLLALRPERRGRWFAVLRLAALVAITVTGIVYHAALRGLIDLKSWAIVSDQIVHTIVPVGAVAGWLLFGPRGLIDRRTVLLSLGFPVLWVAFTLIRGALYPWYPYPFIDVSKLGYGVVAVNCVWVAALMAALAAAALAVDRRLSRTAREG